MKRGEKELEELRDEMPWTMQFHAWRLAAWLKGLSKGERMQLLVKGLSYVLTLGFLDNYRLYLAGVASILGGLSLIVLEAAGDSNGSVKEGVAAIVIGVGVIGAAGKADKQIEATNANTLVVAGIDPSISGVTPIDAAVVVRNLPGPTPPATRALAPGRFGAPIAAREKR